MLNRRQFTKAAGVVAGVAALVGPRMLVVNGSNRESPAELELGSLEDFLDSNNSHIDRKDIEGKLPYDILEVDSKKDRHKKRREATRIAGNFYLTSYDSVRDVVEGKASNLRLRAQWKRDYEVDCRKTFEVVAYNKETNVALLRTNEKNEGRARLHLGPEIPSGNPVISTFNRIGDFETLDPTSYDQVYSGVDLYNQTVRDPNNTGRKRLLDGSRLLETMGTVQPYKAKELSASTQGKHGVHPDEEVLTSAVGYSRNNGQAGFLVDSNGRYLFTGIQNGIILTKHRIDLYDHPLGYVGMQQTGTFFANRKAIKGLIEGYINRLPAPQRN